MNDGHSDPELVTATTAMRHWTDGAAGGDWSALVAMLDPALTFHVPVDGFRGVRQGVPEAKRFFDHLAAVLRADLRVTSTMRDRSRFAFEVEVDGQWLDRDFGGAEQARTFRQALCLVIVTGGSRIRSFHEYVAWPGGLE
jgi:hypothetical protein